MVVKKTLHAHHKNNDLRMFKERKASMSKMIFKENQKDNGRKKLSIKGNKIKIRRAKKHPS